MSACLVQAKIIKQPYDQSNDVLFLGQKNSDDDYHFFPFAVIWGEFEILE
jgi:hypothetical protein